MSVERRTGCKNWYGVFEHKGKRIAVNLGIEVAETGPHTRGGSGDEAYKVSKASAVERLKGIVAAAKEERSTVEILRKLYKARTGAKVGALAIGKIAEAWKGRERKRELSAHYIACSEVTFKRFIEFLANKFPEIKAAGDVSKAVASEFILSEKKRGVSTKTRNDALVLLRSTFKYLGEEAGVFENPFKGIIMLEDRPISRRPFSVAELRAILALVRDDDLLRPLILIAVSTALRRSDCCNLKWTAIDWESGLICVTPEKDRSDDDVWIPMFALLREELLRLPRTSEYVLPAAEKMLRTNADGLTWRLGRALREIEFVEGGTVISGPEATSRKRKKGKGLRSASIRGFHAFRTTFVTLALVAGIPIPLLQKVTGHKTVEIVLKRYFKPKAEDFQDKFIGLMPEFFNGTKAAEHLDSDSSIRLLESMTPKNWRQVQKQLLERLRSADEAVASAMLDVPTPEQRLMIGNSEK